MFQSLLVSISVKLEWAYLISQDVCTFSRSSQMLAGSLVRAGTLKARGRTACAASSRADITVSLRNSFAAALGMEQCALQSFISYHSSEPQSKMFLICPKREKNLQRYHVFQVSGSTT